MGIFVGMILGACIVAGAAWFFSSHGAPPSASPAAKPSQEEPTVTALPGKPGDKPVEKQQDFTFFKTLPKGESAPVTPPPAQVAAQQQTPVTPQQPLEKTVYLQLGAFENAEQADDLKAQLLLMGLEPVTQRAQLPDGRVVHRIRVGPFNDRESVKAMRARLSSNGFTADEVPVN
ncbi:MAG: SPOR domain-containing protein [Azoarcus sp.]|jgi:cell division protein FtsN|nr:SPOR domain-containing protein [Azoarcus sp.]